jgi:hypothetical protein
MSRRPTLFPTICLVLFLGIVFGTQTDTSLAASKSTVGGKFSFGSNKTFTNVTFRGPVRNRPGAHNVTFRNCTFLGRGSNYDMYLGDGASVYDVHFVNCRFVRAQNGGQAPSMITMKARGNKTSGRGRLHDITFRGCHFGTRNAEGKIGSPGMTVEIQDYSTSRANHGFYHINFTRCVFEAGNCATLDYAGTQHGYVGGAILDGRSVVRNCLFKGYSRLQERTNLTGCLCLEMVRGVRVVGCTFWRGWAFTISSSTRAAAAGQATKNVISGNTFDFRVRTSIAQKRAGFARTVLLDGRGDKLTHNTAYLPARAKAAGDFWSRGGSRLTVRANRIITR